MSAIATPPRPGGTTRVLGGITVSDSPLISDALDCAKGESDAARAFARRHGLEEQRARLIWDSVALNSTPSVGLHKEPEVALCTAGIGVEFGFQYNRIPASDMRAILAAFPRLGMKRRFAEAVCRIVKAKPETTWDNFAADFGQRFIHGYARPSTVDFLEKAPFEE